MKTQGKENSTIEKKKFNQQDYINNYKKEHYQRVTAMIPKKEEKLLQHLNSQPSKSFYIVDLIRKDMERKK